MDKLRKDDLQALLLLASTQIIRSLYPKNASFLHLLIFQRSLYTKSRRESGTKEIHIRSETQASLSFDEQQETVRQKKFHRQMHGAAIHEARTIQEAGAVG